MNGFPSGHGRFNGLDPTTERVLIITGSIGIVVILCFISWLVFRNMKRANATGPRRGSRKWLPKWLPWGRKPADDRIKPALAFYTTKGMEAPFLAYDSRELDSPHTISYYGEPKLHPTVSERTTNATTEIFRNGLAIRQSTEPQSLLPYRLVGPKLQINGQIMDTSIIDHPTPSQKANAYYNQSGPAGPQSLDAYNSPTQTQRYPASEVSSLSSGFGDGDIIVTHSNTVVVKPPMAAVRGTETEAEMESEMGNSRRGSWASSSGSVMKRYSVHTTTTTTSDRPARFRSIHSWVNQQKARLKRADSRGQSEQKGAPNAAAT
ncbi:hypothetical protein F5Y17DRAFT_447154 [Xylariaceae sp. FL0594]|nr:hypothetical protein F5Y17DRAFT_447154 [Xylariaceae sp. FL0594]